MALNLTKLTADVAAIETVAASVETVVTEIAAELRALRNEGGGALQNQLDSLASRLEAVAPALGQAVQDGTAAEGETPAPPTSAEVIAQQQGTATPVPNTPPASPGAAQQAADHLDDQAANAP